MSIASATSNAFAATAKDQPEFREAAEELGSDAHLEKVVQWIPSEAVAIYLALVGLVIPSGGVKWFIFAIGIALVVAFVLLNAAIANKRGEQRWDLRKGPAPRLAGRRLIAVLALALIAFVTWACAIPDTPFLDLTPQATRIGAAAALVVAAVLPKVAELLNVQPSSV